MSYTATMPTKKSITKSTKSAKATKPRSATKKSSKAPAVQSLRLTKSQTPFLTVKPSIQSVYWIILGVVVIGFAVWILKLQADIDSIYDSISTGNTVITEPASRMKH